MLELESGSHGREEEKKGDKDDSNLHFDHNTSLELLSINIVSG